MELHHFHVAQRRPGAQRHRQAVAALFARGRVVFVHGRTAAGARHHGFRARQNELAAAHVDDQHAGDALAVGREDQVHGAVLFQAVYATRPYLLGEAVDDLDAGEIALVHRPVEGLPGEGLLMQAAVGIAVEETAELVLQFVDALDRALDQGPGEFLVGQPLAAFDRIHEVALDRVALRQRDVVAALDHARTAALAQQPLDRDGDVQPRIRRMRVQRGEQARAAAAEDQKVGSQSSHRRFTVNSVQTASPRRGSLRRRRRSGPCARDR